jgi:hypothetical protein
MVRSHEIYILYNVSLHNFTQWVVFDNTDKVILKLNLNWGLYLSSML